MPRRRASKGQTKSSRGKGPSSVERWDRREEIPLDEVDQFHEQRDKILLEGDHPDGDVDFLDENEVFALQGMDDLSEDEEVERDEETGDEENGGEGVVRKKVKKKRTVIQADGDSDAEEEEEEEETWGGKKSAYYSSNAAQLDSDDEEAREMEENEARRLQAKQREHLHDEDFGYNEALQKSVEINAVDDIWAPVAKPALVVDKLDKKDMIKHLERTNPEALALAFDWDDIARSLERIKEKLIRPNSDTEGLGLIHVHYQTLQTYAAVLAFYLHLRASPKYASDPESLRGHPIMRRLVTLKQGLQTLEDLSFNLSDSDFDLDDLESDDLDEDFDRDEEALAFMRELSAVGPRKKTLSDADMLAVFRERTKGVPDFLQLAQGLLNPNKGSVKPSSLPRKATLRMDNEPTQGEKTSKKDSVTKSEKKRKVINGASPAVVFDLEEPTLPKAGPSKLPSSKSDKKRVSKSFSGFGEATELDDTDIADKGVRRKALRFHTTKIENASARRQGARNALGGDDDVPYREKKKGKNSNLRKNLGSGGDDLDGEDPEPSMLKRAKQDAVGDDDSMSDDDGYYALVKRQKKEERAAKKAKYEEEKEANSIDFREETSDGQRSISRAILKNKGLTPRRSKSVRNPRVKKRQKFEKAKKKLSSQKAIYKGGIGDPSHYGGEMSGISKVVKSVRL